MNGIKKEKDLLIFLLTLVLFIRSGKIGGYFLGIGQMKVSSNWMSYQEAKAFIQNEGVSSITAYRQWRREGRKPINFPSNPDRKYKEEWEGWSKFLKN